MKKNFLKIAMLAVVVPIIYISVSFIFGLNGPFVRELDESYIWNKCEPIQNVVTREVIGRHIIYRRGFFGVYYLFEYSPGNMSSDDFVIAGRSLWSELSCLPFLGCIIPLSLSEKCEDSSA